MFLFQGAVRIGAVDADAHKSLGGQYGVKGFPTIKIFGNNKNSPEDYNGEISISVLAWILVKMYL